MACFGTPASRTTIRAPWLRVVAALGLVLGLTAGCATASPSGSSAAIGDPLPTLRAWPLPANYACAGIGMEAPLVIAGSPEEGVYGQWTNDRHVPIKWPPGYRAVYAPALTIRDPAGQVIATAGADLLQPRLGGLLICLGPEIEMLPL